MIKRFLKNILPYGVLQIIQKHRAAIRFSGDYPDWQSAAESARGYDAVEIAVNVKENIKKIIAGKEVVCCNYPLLSSLLFAANKCGGSLHVLDFGGAMGNAYWSNRKVLKSAVKDLSWSIVEQASFISAASEVDMNGEIAFFSDIAAARAADPDIHVLLCSSVLQYLEQADDILKQAEAFDYIIIDRAPVFRNKTSCQYAVQTVKKTISPASYPLRIAPKGFFESYFNGKFEVAMHWESALDKSFTVKDKQGEIQIVDMLGMLLQKKQRSPVPDTADSTKK